MLTPPDWMLDAARELSTLDEVDSDGLKGWEFGGFGPTWAENEGPGWEVSESGGLLTMESGSIKIESETGQGLLTTARGLLAALDAFNLSTLGRL